jgi:hypothetical protein
MLQSCGLGVGISIPDSKVVMSTRGKQCPTLRKQ